MPTGHSPFRPRDGAHMNPAADLPEVKAYEKAANEEVTPLRLEADAMKTALLARIGELEKYRDHADARADAANDALTKAIARIGEHEWEVQSNS